MRHVRVLRDGAISRIESVAVVPGDVMLLAEGERIATDAVSYEANALQVDESLLTGESLPVRKCSDMSSQPAPIRG